MLTEEQAAIPKFSIFPPAFPWFCHPSPHAFHEQSVTLPQTDRTYIIRVLNMLTSVSYYLDFFILYYSTAVQQYLDHTWHYVDIAAIELLLCFVAFSFVVFVLLCVCVCVFLMYLAQVLYQYFLFVLSLIQLQQAFLRRIAFFSFCCFFSLSFSNTTLF